MMDGPGDAVPSGSGPRLRAATLNRNALDRGDGEWSHKAQGLRGDYRVTPEEHRREYPDCALCAKRDVGEPSEAEVNAAAVELCAVVRADWNAGPNVPTYFGPIGARRILMAARRVGAEPGGRCNAYGGTMDDGRVRTCDKDRWHTDSHTYEFLDGESEPVSGAVFRINSHGEDYWAWRCIKCGEIGTDLQTEQIARGVLAWHTCPVAP